MWILQPLNQEEIKEHFINLVNDLVEVVKSTS